MELFLYFLYINNNFIIITAFNRIRSIISESDVSAQLHVVQLLGGDLPLEVPDDGLVPVLVVRHVGVHWAGVPVVPA